MVADGPPSQCRSETGEIGQAQKRHREVPEGGHSSRGRAGTDLRPVLDEEHIADPLKRFSLPNRRLLLEHPGGRNLLLQRALVASDNEEIVTPLSRHSPRTVPAG